MFGKSKTKRIVLNTRLKGEARKLTKLLDDGWEIIHQRERGILEFGKPGTEFILRKRDGDE